MRFTFSLLAVSLVYGLALMHQVDAHIKRSGDADVEKRDAIKAAFLKNLRFYDQYAKGKDKLAPVSKTGVNDGVLAG
jgi:hypothetical protein